MLHRISHSLLNWNSFNGHLITFWMFISPLLQHLLPLLMPVTHLTSAKCLKMSVENWIVSKWSTHNHTQDHPHLNLHPTSSHPWSGSRPPPLINYNSGNFVASFAKETIVTKKTMRFLSLNFYDSEMDDPRLKKIANPSKERALSQWTQYELQITRKCVGPANWE